MLAEDMTEYLPYIISILSLCISFYVMMRDRQKFDAIGLYLDSWEHMHDGLYFRIVNMGRRPITPHELIFWFSDNTKEIIKITNDLAWSTFEDNSNKDIFYPCLSESQFFEFTLDEKNCDLGQYVFENLSLVTITDSLGKSVKLKKLAKEIREKQHHFK
ncbi:MAG: hypothetical protein HUJ30_00340 [Gammaproteobacteria bacterium]|nr:hypothetical protein [Gammaproteobacteria bacterium]